ncbi:LmeA family phospholipid-binding protein [Pleurocapsa sp. FMAR1]|uniref:LmeA family phospholipid-binding protein n=1 Tax=Pleurocapsa sp. FMAR1 TaxID=3040204 RepID=UPI0029C8F064|nr:DUF2993 domain-containing protein [Pleurocapsa sp. FMAR1]
MINRILSTAVKFYLRSQVSQVKDLQVKIVGKNRQILQGYIPQVLLSCDRVIYQGLHLNQVEVKGANIGFNLPEVLKKKPFQLLEPIVVDVKLSINSADLQSSLTSPLLQSGLTDLLRSIPLIQDRAISEINWQSIAIAAQRLNLTGIYQDIENQAQKLYLSTGIKLADYHTLDLSPVEIESVLKFKEFAHSLKIDLGQDVAIKELVVKSEQILCSGKITINNLDSTCG